MSQVEGQNYSPLAHQNDPPNLSSVKVMLLAKKWPEMVLQLLPHFCTFHFQYVRLYCLAYIEIINNKARRNLIDAKCRWRSDWLDGVVSFLATAWSNESDATPPGGDNPLFNDLFSSSIL